MTKEQKDKIMKMLAEERNRFTTDCNKRIAEECGKIAGADYMFQKLIDILHVQTDVKQSESEGLDEDSN